MAKSSSQSQNWKSVRGVTLRERSVSLHKFFDLPQISGGRCFMQFKLRAAGAKKIADFFLTVINRKENRALRLLVLRAKQRRILIQQSVHSSSVAAAYRVKEKLHFAHGNSVVRKIWRREFYKRRWRTPSGTKKRLPPQLAAAVVCFGW